MQAFRAHMAFHHGSKRSRFALRIHPFTLRQGYRDRCTLAYESGSSPTNRLRRLEEDMTEPETYTGDAYCVKCKEKRDFTGTVKVSDSGRRMAQGICSVCGTKLNRILGKAQ